MANNQIKNGDRREYGEATATVQTVEREWQECLKIRSEVKQLIKELEAKLQKLQ